jgi:hypothetical protein
LNQKIGTTHLSTIRLQSSIHWPWHHDGMPKHGSHLLHEGVTAKFMPKWPAIVTYTLVKGWTDETTKAFQEAVDKVIDLNPILTWRVYRHRPFPIFHPPGDHFELRADMDSYSKENHDLSLSSTNVTRSSPKNMNCTSDLNFMETNIIPSLDIHCESTGTEICKKLPLFGTHVVLLPNNHACIAIKMSHCLGDGLTVSWNRYWDGLMNLYQVRYMPRSSLPLFSCIVVLPHLGSNHALAFECVFWRKEHETASAHWLGSSSQGNTRVLPRDLFQKRHSQFLWSALFHPSLSKLSSFDWS